MPADPTRRMFYRDFLFEDLAKVKNEIKIADGNRRGPRGGVADPFPAKLYELINDAQTEGLCNIISWEVHGRCFRIHDPDVFARELLPTYWHMTKASSFKRQMNLYGFRRVLTGTDNGCYYHELFLRGRPDLAIIMRREEDPNFYAYAFCPELPIGGYPIVSDVSEQSSSDSNGDYSAEQLYYVREQYRSIEAFSTISDSVPNSIVFRGRFEFLGPQLSPQFFSPITEICDIPTCVDDFAIEIMAVVDAAEFEESAIERMLAREEHALHQTLFC